MQRASVATDPNNEQVVKLTSGPSQLLDAAKQLGHQVKDVLDPLQGKLSVKTSKGQIQLIAKPSGLRGTWGLVQPDQPVFSIGFQHVSTIPTGAQKRLIHSLQLGSGDTFAVALGIMCEIAGFPPEDSEFLDVLVVPLGFMEPLGRTPIGDAVVSCPPFKLEIY